MKKLSIVLLIIFVLNIVGCDKSNTKEDDAETTSGTTIINSSTSETAKNDTEAVNNNAEDVAKLNQKYALKEYKNPNTRLVSFTLDNDGNVYGITDTGTLKKYQNDGKPIKTFKGHEGLSALCYNNGFVYGYDAKKQDVLQINVDDNTTNVVYENLEAYEVKKLVVMNDNIFALVVPKFILNPSHDDVFYMDYDEYMVKININTKEKTDLNIQNPITIYGSTDNNLYVYTCVNKKYTLNVLENDTLKCIKETDSDGYLFVFTLEKGIFTYVNGGLQLCSKKLDGDTNFVLQDNVIILHGNDLQFFNGNAVYLTYIFKKVTEDTKEDVIDNSFVTALSSVYVNRDAENGEVQQVNKLVIKGSNGSINTKQMEKLTGTSAALVSDYYTEQELITKILAKDSEIDIYFMSSGAYLTKYFIDNGIYVKLNDSEIITSHLNNCFDYVNEASKAENGDIWGLPFASYSHAILYNPIYLEKFDSDIDNMKYYDGFFGELEKLYAKKGDLKLYGRGPNFAYSLMADYDNFYNDFPNKQIDYNTDIFKKMFETVWSGWHRDLADDENIKYLDMPFWEAEKTDFIASKAYVNNVDKVILKLDSFQRHVNEAKAPFEVWRAAPLPVLSDKVTASINCPMYAIINPYSNNIELAIKYLETMSQNSLTITTDIPVLLKDTTAYADVFDIEKPLFTDIYNIYKNSIIVFNEMPGTSSYDFIDDYQYGKITLEEAIAELQRYTEMALNE